MKIAIIGYGSRGGNVYAKEFCGERGIELAAVCDKRRHRLDTAQKEYGVKPENCYLSDKEFFSKGKLADLLVVATMDKDHYGHAVSGLKAGYDLLLEKPIADTLERCVEIVDLARKLNRKVFICHVLRYAPFFAYIKSELETGKYGKVSTINMTENVAYWHQSHSYVRWQWGNVEKSTPMLLAKCCHDLDIISWFMDANKCTAVNSFGSLDYFTEKNAPEGCAAYCCDCKYQDTCLFDNLNLYKGKLKGWINETHEYFGDPNSEEDLKKFFEDKKNPFSRCVYKCDNTAVDHQVVNMLYADGATAHLTMTAFADDCYREIHVHCQKGDIYGNMKDDVLQCNIYGGEHKTVDVGKLTDGVYGHGGGDSRLVGDIVAYYEGGDSKGATTIEKSFVSHNIGYAAEESRANGGKLVKIK